MKSLVKPKSGIPFAAPVATLYLKDYFWVVTNNFNCFSGIYCFKLKFKTVSCNPTGVTENLKTNVASLV